MDKPKLETNDFAEVNFTDHHEDGWEVTWVIKGDHWVAFNSSLQPFPPEVLKTNGTLIPTDRERQYAINIAVSQIPERFKVLIKAGNKAIAEAKKDGKK